MNQEYLALLKEIQELQERLLPPSPELSDTEHVKAKIRYFADNVLFEKFYDLINFLNYHTENISTEQLQDPKYGQIVERALQAKNDIQFIYDDSQRDIWEKDIHTNEVMSLIQKSLTHSHSGTCTGLSGTCDRCYAESCYKIPTTVTWSKEEGNLMQERLRELIEQKRTLEFADRLERQLNNLNIDSSSQKSKI